MTHNIFRIKESLLKREIREKWGWKRKEKEKPKTDIFRENTKMTLGDVPNIKSQVKYSTKEAKAAERLSKGMCKKGTTRPLHTACIHSKRKTTASASTLKELAFD